MNDDNVQTAANAWLNALDTGFPANTPTKPFICSHLGCNKSFARASVRQNHFKVAHVSVMYVCAECSEHFNSTNDLKSHEEHSHPGMEYWECSSRNNIRSGCVCGRRFASREALHRHQRCFIASPPGSPTEGLNRQSDQSIAAQSVVEDVLNLGLHSPGARSDETPTEVSSEAVPMEFTKRPLMSPAGLESHTSGSYRPVEAAARSSSIATFFVVDRPSAARSKSS